VTELAGARAVLGTRHRKESVIAPVLEAELGLDVEVLDGLDTDRFGTFSREIPRTSSPRRAARAKALAALEAHGRADLAISSEGSFGPHPHAPFVRRGVELVLLLDRRSGLELVGLDITTETNFDSAEVGTIDEARAFAAAAGFPSHGLIVMSMRDGKPDPTAGMVKGVVDGAVLETAVADALGKHRRAWIETDMRAHLNPTRMRSIERATRELALAARSRCPACNSRGYVVVSHVPGLPCSACGLRTHCARAEVLACSECGRREERALRGQKQAASPFECPFCNP
jgi:hypothetical protein